MRVETGVHYLPVPQPPAGSPTAFWKVKKWTLNGAISQGGLQDAVSRTLALQENQRQPAREMPFSPWKLYFLSYWWHRLATGERLMWLTWVVQFLWWSECGVNIPWNIQIWWLWTSRYSSNINIILVQGLAAVLISIRSEQEKQKYFYSRVYWTKKNDILNISGCQIPG